MKRKITIEIEITPSSVVTESYGGDIDSFFEDQTETALQKIIRKEDTINIENGEWEISDVMGRTSLIIRKISE